MVPYNNRLQAAAVIARRSTRRPLARAAEPKRLGVTVSVVLDLGSQFLAEAIQTILRT